MRRTIEGRLLRQKPPSSSLENLRCGRESLAAGNMKKRENLRDSSKLDPLIFSLFFCALRACDCYAIGLLLGSGTASFNAANKCNDRFFGAFLTQESTVLPIVPTYITLVSTIIAATTATAM